MDIDFKGGDGWDYILCLLKELKSLRSISLNALTSGDGFNQKPLQLKPESEILSSMPQTSERGHNIFYEGTDMEAFIERLEEDCIHLE